MLNKKFKIAFFMLIIGFILIALDVDVRTGFSYPTQYKNTNEVIGEYQFYNIASNYGAKCTYKYIDNSDSSKKGNSALSEYQTSATQQNVTVNAAKAAQTKVIDKVFFDNIHIDIFNDFVGFILIIIACLMFRKVDRTFSLAALCAFCGVILRIILSSLPFFINGLLLCNISMIMGISYLGVCLATSFLFTRGLFKMIPDVCCRDERKWGKMAWFVSFVLMILVTFIMWVSSDFGALAKVGYFFEAMLVLDIFIFWKILKRAYHYLAKAFCNANK